MLMTFLFLGVSSTEGSLPVVISHSKNQQGQKKIHGTKSRKEEIDIIHHQDPKPPLFGFGKRRATAVSNKPVSSTEYVETHRYKQGTTLRIQRTPQPSNYRGSISGEAGERAVLCSDWRYVMQEPH